MSEHMHRITLADEHSVLAEEWPARGYAREYTLTCSCHPGWERLLKITDMVRAAVSSPPSDETALRHEAVWAHGLEHPETTP